MLATLVTVMVGPKVSSQTASWTYTRSTPMHVCPALDIAPHSAASVAASTSASASTMNASLPPHSATIGVRLSAHTAMTLRAVAAEPVKANLSTPAPASAAPVWPKPVTTWNTGCSGTTPVKISASSSPTPDVYSDGLNTTALPAARAYAIEPIGVKIG